MGVWISVEDKLPDNGRLVMTRICDERGERNVQIMYRNKNLWFIPDSGMYVYYMPTHWKPLA